MRARHRTPLLLLPLALAALAGCVDRDLPTAASALRPDAPALQQVGTPTTPGSLVSWGNDQVNQVSNTPTANDFTAVAAGNLHGVAIRRVPFTFTGFFAPVDNTVVNVAKAGSAIPVKFSLGGDQGLDVFASGSPRSQATACEAGAPEGPIGSNVSAGGSSLSYDAATDTYTYVWKTEKAWGNSCRTLTLTFTDGTTKTASFKFTR